MLSPRYPLPGRVPVPAREASRRLFACSVEPILADAVVDVLFTHWAPIHVCKCWWVKGTAPPMTDTKPKAVILTHFYTPIAQGPGYR